MPAFSLFFAGPITLAWSPFSDSLDRLLSGTLLCSGPVQLTAISGLVRDFSEVLPCKSNWCASNRNELRQATPEAG
jgi:hypothetical protein